jgi:hypothetical protein
MVYQLYSAGGRVNMDEVNKGISRGPGLGHERSDYRGVNGLGGIMGAVWKHCEVSELR